MTGRLAASVRVRAPLTGRQQVFRPGDDLPSWARAAITNPAAWVGGVVPGAAAPVEPEPAVPAESDGVEDGGASPEAPPSVPEPDVSDATASAELPSGDVDTIVEPEPVEFTDEPDPRDYEAMTVVALKAEIRSRNEGRADDDLIPADGNKADLIAALEADDETV